MTREERDRRDAARKAHLEQKATVGELSLPLNRRQLRITFLLLASGYLVWQIFAPQTHTFELWFYGLVLTFLCLLPTWLWLEGKMNGLPLWPVYCLNFIPSYINPVLNGSKVLDPYNQAERLQAVLTLAGFLALGTLVVHQITCRVLRPNTPIRAFDLERSRGLLLTFLLAGLVLQVFQDVFWQFGLAFLSAVRGVLSAVCNLGIFGLCFLWGQKKLSSGFVFTVATSIAVLLAWQASSFILAPAIATGSLALVSFVLGRQKIPWGFLAGFVAVVFVLHAGKSQMRQDYWKEGIQGTNEVNWLSLPGTYAEWFANGLFSMGKGETKEGEKVATAADRGVLIHLLMLVQKKTPSQVPFLEGETYQNLLLRLIPRIFYKEKQVSHVGNMILSLHYGLLDEVGIFRTSIAFDPLIEGYANLGYWGVVITAVVMGAVIGFVTWLGCGVPILSYRFLLAVLVLAGLVGANNTVGVMVTNIWQSFLALTLVAFVLMKKLPNPLWLKMENESLSGKKVAGSGGVASPASLTPSLAGSGGAKEGERSPSSISDLLSPNETAPVRHERPTRFVYGEKK